MRATTYASGSSSIVAMATFAETIFGADAKARASLPVAHGPRMVMSTSSTTPKKVAGHASRVIAPCSSNIDLRRQACVDMEGISGQG